MEWISVKEKTPKLLEDVLVYTKSKAGIGIVDKGYWNGNRFVHRGVAEVTHWMSLPEPPKEK